MSWNAVRLISNLVRRRFSSPLHESRCVLATGCVSVAGRRRRNEDRYFTDRRQGLLLVADGVGGHRGGGVASQIVIDTLRECVRDLEPVGEEDQDVTAVEKAIKCGVNDARHRMQEFGRRHPSHEQMSSTVAVAIIRANTLYVSHIGDSRVYRFSRGRLRQLTSDQTFVQALVDAGTITKVESRTHPMRNVVLNVVGARPLTQPPTATRTPLQPGDRILLATDGLTGVVDDSILSEILGNKQPPKFTAKRLVDVALQMGSQDNVTCVIADWKPVTEESVQPIQESPAPAVCTA